LTGTEIVLDLVYLAWETEAGLARRNEMTKAMAGEQDELGIEAVLDGILELQLAEVDEARTLYRRRESANNDGAGIMSVDGNLPGPVVGQVPASHLYQSRAGRSSISSGVAGTCLGRFPTVK